MKAILVIIVCALTIGLVGNAFAHLSEVIGDYKVEVGWKNEPPIAGLDNEIELVVSIATDHDKAMAAQENGDMEEMDNMTEMENMEMTDEDHQTSGEGVSGLANSLGATVELDNKMTPLKFVESSIPGVYYAKYTPPVSGYPMVHVNGTIHDTEVYVTFHPEKVESISTLAPLKQIKAGIEPADVSCKAGMKLILRPTSTGSACVTQATAEKLLTAGWMQA